MTDRLIDAAGDDHDTALRPTSLDGFIGQKKGAKTFLFLSARRAGVKKLLTMCYWPARRGLAKPRWRRLSRVNWGGFRSTSGPVISKAGDLASLLTNLEPHDVLFIDEIHRLSPAVEEILYPAMEDFELDLMIGEGPLRARSKLTCHLSRWLGPPRAPAC